MKKHQVMPALCLDLDGTVRRNKYNHKAFIDKLSDIEIIPGMQEILNCYRKDGYLICGLSNQGGVAHGHKTAEQAQQEMFSTNLLTGELFHLMKTSLCMESGNIFPYNYRSLLRKPYIGMLAIFELEASISRIVIDWNKSIMVGDRKEDEICAKNADIRFFHIDNFLKLSHPLII